MQKELEERTLSLARNSKSFNDFIKHGVTSECFVLYTELFDFISKYYHNYNSIPAETIIKASFPEFTYSQDVKPEEIKYLSDELIKNTIKRRAIRIINDAAETVDIDPLGTVDMVISKLSNIRRKIAVSRSFTDKDALRRYQLVHENRERIGRGVTVGLKTGISLFDDKFIGWQPGDLIAVIGRMGVGKSWLLLYCSCVAYNSGHRVLYISPEMSINEVELRWDTIMGHLTGYTFLNKKLQVGEVNFKEYKKHLEDATKRSDWITVDSNNGRAFNVPSIISLVDEFSPDLVALDGIGLLETGSKESWQKIEESTTGLKNLSQTRKIVTMVTSQVNRAAVASEDGDPVMPRVENISMGDAIGKAASVIISMMQDINKPNVRYITIPKRRNDEAINRPKEIRFSVDEGIISI